MDPLSHSVKREPTRGIGKRGVRKQARLPKHRHLEVANGRESKLGIPFSDCSKKPCCVLFSPLVSHGIRRFRKTTVLWKRPEKLKRHDCRKTGRFVTLWQPSSTPLHILWFPQIRFLCAWMVFGFHMLRYFSKMKQETSKRRSALRPFPLYSQHVCDALLRAKPQTAPV